MSGGNPMIAAAIQSLPGFEAGREFERDRIVAMLRKRGGSAKDIAKRNPARMNEAEAARLARWLETAADDVEADLEE